MYCTVLAQYQFRYFSYIYIFHFTGSLVICCYILGTNVVFGFILIHLNEAEPHLRFMWHDANFQSNENNNKSVRVSLVYASIW